MSDFNQLSEENVGRLRDYYESDGVARVVLDSIAKLRRYEIVELKNVNTVCVTSPTLADLSGIDESDVKHVLKSLAENNCGIYYESRRGFEARLQLSVDLRLEIQRFKDDHEIELNNDSREHDVRHLLKAPPVQQLRPTHQQQTTFSKVALAAYNFRLRSNLEIELKLPKDLTSNEAVRLSMFIKSHVLL